MAAQLPKDFEPLPQAAGVGRHRATRQPYDLTLRVAELAGIEREQARKATEAVLETLAVRISAGEVEDLRKEIPSNLHRALDRGLRERRDAVPMKPSTSSSTTSRRARASTATTRPTTPAPCSPRCAR
jgi:uncharacterized protein (DUF2267 family)